MFANDGFKIRGWDETGLHVGSAMRWKERWRQMETGQGKEPTHWRRN